MPTRALGPDDLIAAHYTLARADRHGVARVPFQERVVAAAGAGFAGLGIQPHDHRRTVEAGATEAELLALLDEHGVVVAEVDGVPWWPGEGGLEALERDQEEALRLAALFDVDHVGPLVTDCELPFEYVAITVYCAV